MAERFVRIDLTADARDYRPIAVEPGVPMLDPSGANDKILFKWLGGLVAEPEWEGESVSFYARDDHGGRLEEVVCQPASKAELEGPLLHNMETLKERIDKAKPETSTERAILNILKRTFAELTEDENRDDLDSYFFRYRDVQGNWRLVWCWGFQRVDVEPAPTVVCTDTSCSLLFVRRPGQSPKCPSCEALLAVKPVKRTPWKRYFFLLLLLLLLGGGLAYWYLYPGRLIAAPDTWAGPAGSRIEFDITKAGLFAREDVTRAAVAVAADPSVVRFDRFGTTATAANPGRTVVRFYLGKLSASVTVDVGPPQNPRKISIEPRPVELGIGTTANLKLMGEYEDGSIRQLTDRIEWIPKNDGIVYANGGLLEGLGEGATTVSARFRASPEAEPLEATAEVTVAKIDFKSLEAAIEPSPVNVGRASDLRLDAVAASGKKYSVLESSLLDLGIEPSYLASSHGTFIRGEHPGTGTLRAKWGERLSAELPFEVTLGAGVDSLVVAPEQLNLAVGEIYDLSIASPSRAPIRISSSEPAVVEVTDSNRLIGRSEGTAQVEVSQEGEKRTVAVTVTKLEILAASVDPPRAAVAVDHSAGVRVLGWLEGGRHIELAPDLLDCDAKPSPRHADFNSRSMELFGVRPTRPDAPERLAFSLGKLRAEAPVDVVMAPFQLELTPAGPVDLPLGQRRRLQGWANYSGGHRVGLFAERMKWHADPPAEDPSAKTMPTEKASAIKTPGLVLRGSRVCALKAGAGPIEVWASYFGRKSNRVQFKSVAAEPVKLKLEVDRTLRLAGEPGRVTLSGTGPRGDVDLVPEMAAFASAKAEVLTIDEKTGAFRAVAASPRKVAVTATHAASKEPARLELRVVDPDRARLVFKPASVRMAVDEVAPLELLLEARIGEKPDQIERVPLAGPGVGYTIAKPEAVRWYPPSLTGLAPASQFEMGATYRPYIERPAKALVEVVPAVEPKAIRVVPSEVSLAPGQTIALTLQEQLPDSDEWKEVRPGAVAWQVPPELIAVDPAGGLRPTIRVPRGTDGRFDVFADYGGQRAVCLVAMKEKGPDPNDPAARVLVVREPPGEYLPIGMRQRYSVVVEKDGVREPVANVRWPDDFENEYVRWDAPVLTAREPGHEQWFEAEAGGRVVRFRTATINPIRGIGEKPVARELPSGVAFDDFRAEVTYPQGYTQVVVDGGTMQLYVGESRQIGTNLIVYEEETDISRSCELHPLQPSIVRFNPEIRSLVGQSPGKSNVAFTWRDRLATVTVEVLPALKIDGKLVVEPAEAKLAAGQAVAMRVLVISKDGIRLDRTDSALLTSSAPDVITIRGHRACGMGAGVAEISAILPGMDKSENARLTVTDDPITELLVEPLSVDMSVGDRTRLEVRGRAACGTHPLFSQPDLSIAAGGANPDSIRIVGADEIDAVSPGRAAVDVAWQGKLKKQVPVSVTADSLAALIIDPPRATIQPGQALVYEVTGLRGQRRRMLGPEDGLKLFVDDTQVAQVLPGMTVAAKRPGRTSVVAQLGGQRAVAVLNVTPAGELLDDVVTGVDPGRIAQRYVDGSILVDGSRYIYDDDRGWVVMDGDVVTRPGLYPTAGVVELRFVPEVLRIPTGSPGAGIRVVEVLADGTDGRDVTGDPNLEIDQPLPAGVARFDRLNNAFVPTSPGQARAAARLGTLTARPLLIQVGEGGTGRLQVFPDPLTLWAGETETFGSVKIIPGDDLMPFDIDYRVTVLSGDNVSVEDGNRLRALSPGVSQVQVTTIDPAGSFGGLSSVATVEVISAEELQIEPTEISLAAGAMTPPISVSARGADGLPYQVPATLESLDQNILAPAEPEFGARFVAKTFGGTQLRAAYRGREAFIDVTVTGKRFVDFNTTLSEGQQDFTVEIEVLAAASEGPLEYRVYAAGQTPPASWTPNEVSSDTLRAVRLPSPRLEYLPRSARYQVIIEARSLTDNSVQKFPYTFRLKPTIEQTDPDRN